MIQEIRLPLDQLDEIIDWLETWTGAPLKPRKAGGSWGPGWSFWVCTDDTSKPLGRLVCTLRIRNQRMATAALLRFA